MLLFLFESNASHDLFIVASVVPTSNNVENEIARLTVLIKQAVNAGDMEKARQYLIQKKVYRIIFVKTFFYSSMIFVIDRL